MRVILSAVFVTTKAVIVWIHGSLQLHHTSPNHSLVKRVIGHHLSASSRSTAMRLDVFPSADLMHHWVYKHAEHDLVMSAIRVPIVRTMHILHSIARCNNFSHSNLLIPMHFVCFLIKRYIRFIGSSCIQFYIVYHHAPVHISIIINSDQYYYSTSNVPILLYILPCAW